MPPPPPKLLHPETGAGCFFDTGFHGPVRGVSRRVFRRDRKTFVRNLRSGFDGGDRDSTDAKRVIDAARHGTTFIGPKQVNAKFTAANDNVRYEDKVALAA